ncbi:MAG: Ig-like domain-containing protein [Lachnospiraceae bacterium]|nr:Ig-like domain-containing protein [Lachnospiraceae bacterium]
MVYDSADDCFYWAAFSYNSYYGTFGGLVKIVLGTDEDGAYTVEETVLGEIEGSAEIAGLLKLEDRGGLEIPEVDEITALDIEEESVSLLVGGTADLTTIFTPWYATDIDVLWESADESVAMVDVTGTVTATGVGETVITATNPATGLSDTCTITVVDPQSVLNGYIITDNYYYQWATFYAGDLETYIVWTDEGFTDISAAEYYDGYIYAYDAVGSFYRIDESDYTMEKIGELDVDATIIDMAFDYSTGYMYALTQDAYLFIVDLMTGHVDTLDYWTWLTDDYYGSPVGLAVSTDGTIYYVTDTSFLCTYDLETFTYTQIGLTGVTAYTYLQSMTYDHDTDELYWAAMDGLYYMDMATGSALNLGVLDSTSMSEIIGLYTVPSEENLPELDYVAVESADVTSESVTLLEGMTTTAPVDIRPYNATDRTITWTIEDESIASVDGTQITGLKAGTTTAVGTVENGEYSFTLAINVLESAGALNAYILYDQSTANGYFWGTFNDYDLSSGEALATPDEYTVYAGEYYDGMIYAYGMNEDTWDYEVMVIDAETFEVVTSYVDGVDYDYPAFFEMAFDYSTGTLYAVGQAGGVNSSDNSYLYMIDTATGACYTVGQASANLYTLACSEDGIMYAIDADGYLYTVDKSTAELTYIGYTGYPANQYQSMAFDYDTGNLYWAQCGYDSWSWTYTMEFLIVNTEDASVTKLGTLGAAGCQAVALYSVPDKDMTIGDYEATGVLLDSTALVLNATETAQLSATLAPVSVQAAGATFTWSSSDEDVATVDENGLVTAVAAGTATITVSAVTAGGTVSGTCKVTVLSENAAIYAMYSSGFDIFSVYDPTDMKDYVYYSDSDDMADVYMEFSAYNSDSKTFYSVDYDGYVWSYQYTAEDGITNVSRSESDVYTTLAYLGELQLIDLTVNAFNGGLYAMVAYYAYDEEYEYYYLQYGIMEIAPATAEVSEAGVVSQSISSPVGFTFTAEDYIVVYDYAYDYIYGQALSTDPYEAVSGLFWASATFMCGSDKMALCYSETLDSVLLYGYNWNSGCYELCEYSISTGSFSIIGETWYDSGTFDVIFVE